LRVRWPESPRTGSQAGSGAEEVSADAGGQKHGDRQDEDLQVDLPAAGLDHPVLPAVWLDVHGLLLAGLLSRPGLVTEAGRPRLPCA